MRKECFAELNKDIVNVLPDVAKILSIVIGGVVAALLLIIGMVYGVITSIDFLTNTLGLSKPIAAGIFLSTFFFVFGVIGYLMAVRQKCMQLDVQTEILTILGDSVKENYTIIWKETGEWIGSGYELFKIGNKTFACLLHYGNKTLTITEHPLDND